MNIFTTFRDMSRGPRVICRIRPFEDNWSLVNFNTVAVSFLEFLDMKFFIIFLSIGLLEIMIFILLPLLTRALNVTGYARTDVQGRFWEETYDCQGKCAQLLM